jgi:hypothetical protein
MLGAFVRVGLLIAFLTALLTLLGPTIGILITKRMEARKVPAVKIAPVELADYSVSKSSGTTLSYFGYESDVPWNANFKQRVGKGLVEVQFESGQNVVPISRLPELVLLSPAPGFNPSEHFADSGQCRLQGQGDRVRLALVFRNRRELRPHVGV